VLRLVGLWSMPEDKDAFDREYLGSHFPQLDGLAGSLGTKTSRCIDGPYLRMTEVSFRTIEDVHDALETDLGKRVLNDATALAQKYGIRLEVLVVAETN
jgi:uncharacterized protein (TIGR02118 family)